MDGNRRWAKKHMLESVLKGHEKGVDVFIDTCKWCQELGIPYLTVYAFSTENWNRNRDEVAGLFRLMGRFFENEVGTCIERDIRMVIVGDLSRLEEKDAKTVERTMEMTRHCKSLICNGCQTIRQNYPAKIPAIPKRTAINCLHTFRNDDTEQILTIRKCVCADGNHGITVYLIGNLQIAGICPGTAGDGCLSVLQLVSIAVAFCRLHRGGQQAHANKGKGTYRDCPKAPKFHKEYLRLRDDRIIPSSEKEW